MLLTPDLLSGLIIPQLNIDHLPRQVVGRPSVGTLSLDGKPSQPSASLGYGGGYSYVIGTALNAFGVTEAT
jgi:hypothetical protein